MADDQEPFGNVRSIRDQPSVLEVVMWLSRNVDDIADLCVVATGKDGTSNWIRTATAGPTPIALAWASFLLHQAAAREIGLHPRT